MLDTRTFALLTKFQTFFPIEIKRLFLLNVFIMKTNKQSAKKKRSSQRFNCFSAKKRTTMKTDQSSCYCLADPDHFRAKKSDWEEIFQIPGMTNITLMGNDSLQTIETCKILLASLGTKFEALLGQPTIHLNYPFSTVQVLHEFSLSGECNCDETNFEPLLKLAKKFNIKGIQLFGGLFQVPGEC